MVHIAGEEEREKHHSCFYLWFDLFGGAYAILPFALGQRPSHASFSFPRIA